MSTPYCTLCQKVPVKAFGDICRACNFQAQVTYELSLDQDDQDWSFAHCEECGSILGGDGLCRNTNCGASPDVGVDWQ